MIQKEYACADEVAPDVVNLIGEAQLRTRAKGERNEHASQDAGH
jgi:hypothetical protein